MHLHTCAHMLCQQVVEGGLPPIIFLACSDDSGDMLAAVSAIRALAAGHDLRRAVVSMHIYVCVCICTYSGIAYMVHVYMVYVCQYGVCVFLHIRVHNCVCVSGYTNMCCDARMYMWDTRMHMYLRFVCFY
jgi:hypothetical protein